MATTEIFTYGDKEIEYLRAKDKRLAEVIDRVGKVEREVIPDLFTALVNSIIGQQISTKAHITIWERMQRAIGEISPESIGSLSTEELQKFGITFKKAEYIKNAARKIADGSLDIEKLNSMPDNDVCAELVKLDGIGIWTAEMLMIFSMQRPDNTELWRFGNTSGYAYGVSPPQDNKRIVCKIQAAAVAIRFGCKFVFLGCGRRCDSRNERLCPQDKNKE